MPIMTSEIALKFCELCNWVHESWTTHRTLFDNNRKKEKNIGRCSHFTRRLSVVTQEYSLQQLAKLHDRAIQGKSTNLTIEYMIEFGEWGEQLEDIQRISAQLVALGNKIIPARHKLLSHNDLETILADEPLGEFSEGADEEYFDALQHLVNVIHEKWLGGPYPFNDLVEDEVHEFLHLLEHVG